MNMKKNYLFYLTILVAGFIFYSNQTPLDDYVNTPDPHYNYSLVYVYNFTGYKMYVLNMTSQKWQDG